MDKPPHPRDNTPMPPILHLPSAILALLLLTLPARAADAPRAEQPFFPLMAWNHAPNDPAVLKKMRDCGLTVAGFVCMGVILVLDPRTTMLLVLMMTVGMWLFIFRVDRKTRLLSLKEMRAAPALATMRTLQPGNRLSITPVTPSEWKAVMQLLESA